MADNISGIVLDIPPTVLQRIKDADKAIKELEQTSRHAKVNINADFGLTMVSGVDSFIQKVKEAQNILGNLKVPTIDASGLSSAIQELSQAIATIDKSATTGSNRLIRIANAMTALQIANPNPQLFQNVADGIAKIGNTSQQTIDNVKNLATAMAQLARDIRTVQNAQNAQNANTATAAQYNKLYKEQAELIRQKNELGRKGVSATAEEKNLLDGIKGRIAEINKQIDKLNQKKQTAASDLANLRGENKVNQAKNITTAKGAVDYAQQARSLKVLQDAYKNLKAVMETVDPNTSTWKRMNAVLGQTRTRIEEIKKQMGEFKNHASGVGDIAGQLSRRLAGVFSVAAITGYINKMIEVRAQFELQQTALRAILQDKQQADQVFQQVQQLALQSPFSIMQMTTFTKQLAAYRIEADKLVGTTKMLADVSAGLGVDMGRLILAYGQVKSANYLRACLGCGTKVKMFDGTFKNVEDIVVGDVLMGDDEQPRHVSKLYQGEQQMYRVSYLGGSFRCNEHHILTVYDALKMRVSDIFVLDYLKEPYRYHGVKRVDGAYKTFIMKVEKDTVDTYYGFSIDGNHRFIIEGNVVTHNTEVRQFTEAGLNIAGELATYFSEIQGKMVSVGDVMEMITKRMVRFEDVEEVFKRVTSAGGLFYDMQKKQSDTLGGQLQRIKDAMSIMFNEIGKSNQGVISWMLKTIRELISSWRELAPYINAAGFAMATWLVTAKAIPAVSAWLKSVGAGIAALPTLFKNATVATKTFDAASKSAAASNPWAALITAIVAVGVAIWQACTAADALDEEFSRITEETSTDMWNLIEAFRKNADAVRDTTKSYEERKEALEELHNTFKGILPDQMLEEKYIQNIADGYEEATEAIKVYSAEKARQAAMDSINTEKEKKWNDWIDDMKDKYGVFRDKIPELENASDAAVRGIIGNITMQIREEYEKGMIKTAEEGYNRFVAITKEKFSSASNILDDRTPEGFEWKFKHMFTADMTLGYTSFRDAIDLAKDKEEEFTKQYEKNINARDKADQARLRGWMNQYDLMAKRLNEFNAAMQKMADLKAKGEWFGENSNPNDKRGITDDAAAVVDKTLEILGYINAYEEKMGLVKTSWAEVRDATDSATEASSRFSIIQENMINAFGRYVEKHTKVKAAIGWAQDLVRNFSTLSTEQRGMVNTGKDVLKLYGLAPGLLDKLRISAETNYSAAAQSAKDLSDQATDNIKKIKATANALIQLGKKSNIAISIASALAKAEAMFGTTLDKEKKMQEAFALMAKLWGYHDKSEDKKGRGSDKELNRWQSIKKAIDDANKSWEKYRKTYNVEKSNAMILQQYSKVFSELGVNIGDFYKKGTYSAKELADALQNLKNMTNATTEQRKKFVSDLSRDIETAKVEVGIKVREEDIKEFKRDLEDIFNNYELSKTFADLGVDIDIVYTLGGKPTTLEDIAKQLKQAKLNIGGKAGSEEEYKAIEEAEKRLAKLEQKNAEERAKNYIKYLTQSLDERAQIEVKAQRDISKTRQDATLDDFSKEQAIAERKKKMSEELAKADLQALQNSRIYIDVFNDMERASKQELQYVIDRIKSLIEANKDISPENLKVYLDVLKKAQDGLAQKSGNFFSDFKTVIEYNLKRNDLLKERMRLQENINSLQDTATEQSTRIYDESLKLNGIADKNSAEYKEQADKVEKQQKAYQATLNSIKELLRQMGLINDKIDKGEKATGSLNKTWSGVAGVLNSISSALSDVGEGLENMGLGSDLLSDNISSAQDIIGGTLTAGTGAVQAFTDPTPWGKMQGAIQAIGGAVKLVGAIFSIGDKKKERQIQRLQRKIEDLQKAYEKLHDAIEKAFAFDDYNAGYEKSLKNLQAQRQATQEQLALEESKKNSDREKIKQYKDSIDELIEKEKELKESRYETMGSLGDGGIFSEAEAWVSAWLDAYKETGDGLDALGDKWDEFLQNLVIKQATSAVVSRRMKKYIDQINAAIDKGSTGLSLAQTFAEIGQNLKDELGDWNKDLKEFFDAVGIKGSGELLLSDLQKGIQNITEPQAAAIEAYLNSMRFAVFEQNGILTSMLTAIQSQYSATEGNSVLNEVKSIRLLVASIDERLSRVIISRNSSNSGYVMKVG